MWFDFDPLATLPMLPRHPEDLICLRIGHAWGPASVTGERWQVLSHAFVRNERGSIVGNTDISEASHINNIGMAMNAIKHATLFSLQTPNMGPSLRLRTFMKISPSSVFIVLDAHEA